MNKSNSTAKSPRTVRTTAFVLAVITVVTVACYIAVSVFVAVSANEIKLSDYEIKGDTRESVSPLFFDVIGTFDLFSSSIEFTLKYADIIKV